MDFLNEMLYALTSAYSHKDRNNLRLGLPIETNIGKLFSIFAWGLDTVQEQADLIRLWDDIDYACGSVLDRYGANFGVSRLGADDRFYRLVIKIKLLAQLSGGDIDTVLNAAASLLEVPVEKLILKEVFPAKISLDVNEDDLSPETLDTIESIVGMIKRILAAGIGIIATLLKYREFRNDAIIGTALFDHTHLSFDLPDARPTYTEVVRVETAAFERSGLTFSLPDARRSFAERTGLSAAAFERTGLSFEIPGDVRRTFTETAEVRPVLFERTELTTKPVPAQPQEFVEETRMTFAVFEYSRILLKPIY